MGIYVYEAARAAATCPTGRASSPISSCGSLDAGGGSPSSGATPIWYDIGTLEEYERAARDIGERPHAFVK